MSPLKTRLPSGRTILLVDDDTNYLEAMALLLENEGHRVLRSTDGEQALRLLRENSIDLLLLDYYMPGMTGEEVVVRLREFNPFVQVILQTLFVATTISARRGSKWRRRCCVPAAASSARSSWAKISRRRRPRRSVSSPRSEAFARKYLFTPRR